MKPILFTSLLISVFCISSFAQYKSAYTSTKTNACRTIESNPNEAGSYIGECKGVGGYKIQLLEGDIRQTLNVITPSRKKYELNFWGLYSGFSAIGEKIEWRTKAGVPVSLIARYNVANADDSTKSTSYLMIAKIGRRSSCVTDVVKPGPKQNEEARILADAAAGKQCMQ